MTIATLGSCLLLLGGLAVPAGCDEPAKLDTRRGDALIAAYFRHQTDLLRQADLADVKTLADWQNNRVRYRAELFDMLGLEPLPPRTPLHAKITGRVEHDEFTVERLHFQSRPGLYVTGNLYLPKQVDKPLPTILYVCGHGGVKDKQTGVSYGNKVHYQHHGGWFARNGYVCLTIDSLQLGEIEAIHHGTYRYDMWWWLNRGYTPAGVEAWNCIRALDYLETRREVDPKRFGVTGRSGGGAYSWWIAALDDRIRAAVPVAGVADLQNHVVDGCVEGHCDCMYFSNTYRWDYAKLAALVAPRPLLISNTDTDRIFPLDGVVRVFNKARRIYALHGAADKIALNITAGGHKDTQELRVHAFRWLNYHLKDGKSDLIDKTAVKFFDREQLRVFDPLPTEERNTTIQESFTVLAAPPALPRDPRQWDARSARWRHALKQKTFAAWPADPVDMNLAEVATATHQGIEFTVYRFTSQRHVPLRLYVARRATLKQPKLVVLNVLDEQAWAEMLAAYRAGFADLLEGEQATDQDPQEFQQLARMFQSQDWAMAYVAPRGIGPTAWDQSKKKQVQHRRRFYLLGQTLDGMRVWDVRRAVQATRKLNWLRDSQVWLQSHRRMAGVTLYAALFEPHITRLDLYGLPASHRQGPFLLNVRRILDTPQTVAMVAERSRVVLYETREDAWRFPAQVVKQLKWNAKQLQIREPKE